MISAFCTGSISSTVTVRYTHNYEFQIIYYQMLYITLFWTKLYQKHFNEPLHDKNFIVKFFQRSFEVNEGSTCVKFRFHFEVILWKSGFRISKYSNLERTRFFHPSRDCDNLWHICRDDQFLNRNHVGIKHKYILYLVNHFTNLSNGTFLMFLDVQFLDFIYRSFTVCRLHSVRFINLNGEPFESNVKVKFGQWNKKYRIKEIDDGW